MDMGKSLFGVLQCKKVVVQFLNKSLFNLLAAAALLLLLLQLFLRASAQKQPKKKKTIYNYPETPKGKAVDIPPRASGRTRQRSN